jgi:DNA polymerase III alpha subunit (gram-positive type)
MILLSLDLETTGLDTQSDEAIEVGYVLWSTGQRRVMEASSFLAKPKVKTITQEITGITHLHPAAVEKYGFESSQALDNLLASIQLADGLIGQNILRYDNALLEAWAKREQRQTQPKLIIDTRTDLPGVESKHLGYMLADIGKINPFPHSALSDCYSVVLLLDHYCQQNKAKLSPDEYLNEVVKRAQSPAIVVQSHQDRADNALAKKQKFGWNPTRKIWWKVVKQCDLDDVVKACSFNISVLSNVTPEELWYE